MQHTQTDENFVKLSGILEKKYPDIKFQSIPASSSLFGEVNPKVRRQHFEAFLQAVVLHKEGYNGYLFKLSNIRSVNTIEISVTFAQRKIVNLLHH